MVQTDTEVRLLNAVETGLLTQVVKLADSNRSSLGFMPEQAFEPFAKDEQIIIALADEEVLGYLLFRRVVSKHRVAIAHLCVGKNNRGKGVPEQLFKFLVQHVRKSHATSGILLKCRREYTHATAMWERMGFVPRGEVPGRGRERKPLTCWYYDLGNPDLFSALPTEERMKVVIDANVFFDLNEAPSKSKSPEAHSLLADWLADEIVLCITDEILHEINRNQDATVREKGRRIAEQRFCDLKYDEEHRNEILYALKSFIKRPENPRNNSDIKHLANSIAAEARYFVTRDDVILAHGDQIAEDYGLLVRRPVDVVVNLDQLRNAGKYIESRFVEHSTRCAAVKSGEEDDLAAEFVTHSQKEKKNELRGKLRMVLSKPDEYLTKAWRVKTTRPTAFFTRKVAGENAEVLLLRCKKEYVRLLERIVKELIDEAVQAGVKCLQVTDQFLPDYIQGTLAAYHFYRNPHNNCWYRLTISGSNSVSEINAALALHLPKVTDFTPSLGNVFIGNDTSTVALYQMERSLWPAKVEEANVACFVVPIQERWARQLFDEQISEAELFGFEAALLFSRRKVYYRAATPALPQVGRILWYVSRSKNYAGICAASYVDAVTIGNARPVFRKFEGIGTYRWRDISELTDGDADASIMAFEFSDTERLSSRLSLGRIQEIFIAHGRKANSFNGPVRIDHKLFLALYQASH